MKKQRIPFRDHTAEAALFFRRTVFAIVVMFILLAILVGNLYHLQVTRYQDYTTRSDQNRIKLVPIPPSRGIIYDRYGVPLATNRTIYQLEIDPEQVPDLKATIKALAPLVNLTAEDLHNFEKERKRSRRFNSIVLKSSLNDLEIARFSVNQYRFPGVEIMGYLQRYYPYGAALTHVVGYVSKINDKDVERLTKEDKIANYAATRDIGKLGIERYYESILHGKTGYEEVEVNNRGRVIRQLQQQPPQAGQDIYLSIDLKLQQYIEKLLAGSRAAVIVSDPRTGEILAMVSNPSYNPNPFVDGISSKAYKELLNDPNKPLINRATQGLYPPASTVKPYIAVSALSANIITPQTELYSSGSWLLPGTDKRYRDWKRGGHGRIDAVQAIEQSADTFFYQVAYDMGINRLSTWMKKFGFGSYTAIDLDEERDGLMPTPSWKMKRFKKPWYQGDTIPVGIGQGYWLATPIQINKALMTLINDGKITAPHLLLSVRDGNNLLAYQAAKNTDNQLMSVPTRYWNLVKEGMYDMANKPSGTGHSALGGTRYKIAAKSGTAQVFGLKQGEIYDASKIPEHLRDHKLMIAFAPYQNPKIAVSVILENGGNGVPVGNITREIMDYIMLGGTQKTPLAKPNLTHFYDSDR